MMIDAHCHIDQYPNPIAIVNECEAAGIITIGVTNLPSHFELGYPHLSSCKKVRLALGLHPLHAEQHRNEFPTFVKNLDKTSYIGEVGLDFSREGIATKSIQIESFGKILTLIKNKSKLLTIHSRNAERTVLDMLVKENITNAIFHWYSGPLQLIDEIAEHGFYFSINPAMIKSKKGQQIIARIPRENLLTETDGPFIEKEGKPLKPENVSEVIGYIANLWGMPFSLVEETIFGNFKTLINELKK